ncbi:MAG: family N-acetyltransferase [Chitinophagaceae bacterium]|nr:family N-acetyltransferase [Chitinophagaceae bacterium]
MTEFIIRPIEQKDNKDIAAVIRKVMEEFNVAMTGSVYTDPTTDDLFNLFKTPLSFYWVVESAGKIVGGGGIYPTEGLPHGYCELVKYYLLPQVRGKGLGKLLVEKCFDAAKQNGFNAIYLESFPELETAIGLYRKFGFENINTPLGHSGHYACNVWMVKRL